jgi:hypothetical protein
VLAVDDIRMGMVMRTKLSLICDKVIEAGWLAAVVVVPLFFNIHSSRVFEPDKLSLLRSIALVMAGAWLIRTVEAWRASRSNGRPREERPSVWHQVRQTPLAVPTLLLVLIYLVSTAFSLDPAVSLLGSYQRLQGTYTTLSYIVIFALLLQGMRTKAAVSPADHDGDPGQLPHCPVRLGAALWARSHCPGAVTSNGAPHLTWATPSLWQPS